MDDITRWGVDEGRILPNIDGAIPVDHLFWMREVIRETALVRSFPSFQLTSLTRTLVGMFPGARAGTTPTQTKIGASLLTMFPPELDLRIGNTVPPTKTAMTLLSGRHITRSSLFRLITITSAVSGLLIKQVWY